MNAKNNREAGGRLPRSAVSYTRTTQNALANVASKTTAQAGGGSARDDNRYLRGARYAAAPYSSNPDPDTSNEDDGVYRSETTLTVTQEGDGYLGLITIGVRGSG